MPKRHRSPDTAATDWLARRDRGLSPREQDEYLQWLCEDERHLAAIGRAEATLRRVLQLSARRHEHRAEPNPDLLARPWSSKTWLWPTMAAAAALALGLWWQEPAHVPSVAHKSYLRTNERLTLPDGSLAELREGARLDVIYSPGERRVRLVSGEAQFSVMKNPARPFVVESGGVTARALGTVFSVELGAEAVSVLVTEGKVGVGAAATAPGLAAAPTAVVLAGQQALLPLANVGGVPAVTDLSPEELRRALEWQSPRLLFHETPLADAIAEFNRRNHRQLVLGDATLGDEPIGGSFRPDNVEGFVRLLSVTLKVRAETHGPDETVLFRR